MAKVSYEEAMNCFYDEASQMVKDVVGEERAKDTDCIIVKPYSDHQFIMATIEDDEYGKRRLSIKVSDCLLMLPTSEDTLDIFVDEDEVDE